METHYFRVIYYDHDAKTINFSTILSDDTEVTQRTYASQQTANTNQLNNSNQRIADNQTNARAAEQVSKDLEASRAERCKQARTEYDKTLNSRKLYREKDGQREFLNDAEIAQERVEARKRVDAICGPQG